MPHRTIRRALRAATSERSLGYTVAVLTLALAANAALTTIALKRGFRTDAKVRAIARHQARELAPTPAEVQRRIHAAVLALTPADARAILEKALRAERGRGARARAHGQGPPGPSGGSSPRPPAGSSPTRRPPSSSTPAPRRPPSATAPAPSPAPAPAPAPPAPAPAPSPPSCLLGITIVCLPPLP